MIWGLKGGEGKHNLGAISSDIHSFNLFFCQQLVGKVEFFAHLDTSNPNTHRSDDLQVVQDEFLQFSDAATLNEKQSVSLCCIS